MAFQDTKRLLLSPIVLKYYNSKFKSILLTDASSKNGIGFALIQLDGRNGGNSSSGNASNGGNAANGSADDDNPTKLDSSVSRRLVQCGSRSLTETEKRYAPIELEALAISYAVEKCSIFLKGGPKFEIWTDHKPLESIFKKHYVEVTNPRVKRFMERITSMDGFDL